MNKIEIEQWSHTCGDGCCDYYGIDVIVNDKRISCRTDEIDEVVYVILKEFGIEAEVIYTIVREDDEE